MAPLSRTASVESATSLQASQAVAVDNGKSSLSTVDGVLNASDASREPRPGGVKTRTLSHSLLSTSPSISAVNRKSRFADAGTTGASIGRASISMPPPATKPPFTYRPSTSRRPSSSLLIGEKPIHRKGMQDTPSAHSGNAMGEAEDVEKTPNQSTPGMPHEPSAPLVLPEASLRPPGSDTDGSSNRLSLSSLHSLGSVIYNGVTGSAASAPQSTASSNAGSVRSNTVDLHGSNSAPLSPSKSSMKGETPSSATTATHAVSVTANTQLEHTGLNPSKKAWLSLQLC